MTVLIKALWMRDGVICFYWYWS